MPLSPSISTVKSLDATRSIICRRRMHEWRRADQRRSPVRFPRDPASRLTLLRRPQALDLQDQRGNLAGHGERLQIPVIKTTAWGGDGVENRDAPRIAGRDLEHRGRIGRRRDSRLAHPPVADGNQSRAGDNTVDAVEEAGAQGLRAGAAERRRQRGAHRRQATPAVASTPACENDGRRCPVVASHEGARGPHMNRPLDRS